MNTRIPSSLRRAWWVIEDNTSPMFRVFAIVALFLLTVLGACS